MGSLLLMSGLLLAQAEEANDAGLRLQVRSLVKQLDDNSKAKREDAEKSLTELGPKVLELLPPVGRNTSAEVKVRLQRIRKNLEKAAAEAATKPTTVTLKGDMTLGEAVAAIEKQTGNKFELRGQVGQQPVSAKLEKVPFWKAIDDLLDQAQATVYTYGGKKNTLSLSTRAAEETDRVARGVYSGMFRFEGVSIQSTRNLRNPANQSLRLMMETSWEPRISPVVMSFPMTDLKAVDESGNELTITSQNANLEVGVQEGISAVELNVPIDLPARSVKKIASLKGKMTAVVTGEVKAFEFANLSEKAQGVEQKRAGVAVVLDRVQKNGELYEFRVRVRFEDAAGSMESHRAWIYNHQAYLVDPKGNPIEDAGSRLSRQADNEIGMNFLYDYEMGLKGCKFIYKTPVSVIRMPVEFELKDVELP